MQVLQLGSWHQNSLSARTRTPLSFLLGRGGPQYGQLLLRTLINLTGMGPPLPGTALRRRALRGGRARRRWGCPRAGRGGVTRGPRRPQGRSRGRGGSAPAGRKQSRCGARPGRGGGTCAAGVRSGEVAAPLRSGPVRSGPVGAAGGGGRARCWRGREGAGSGGQVRGRLRRGRAALPSGLCRPRVEEGRPGPRGFSLTLSLPPTPARG